jgi:hypothetical protein
LVSEVKGAHLGFQLCWEFGPGVDERSGKWSD